MRHQKVINHLGRTSSHRKAMLANMASSLILHKRITTTTTKAKALRTYVEPLITKSKKDSTHSRRMVFSYLKDKVAVAELFREVSPKVGERPGGYTRILKTGNRIGDNAEMCVLELVDYNENMLGGEAVKTKTTRRKRTTKKKTEGVEENTAAAKKASGKTKKSEAPVVEGKGEAKVEAKGMNKAETEGTTK
jgi:large subunit ribosomal protein L17